MELDNALKLLEPFFGSWYMVELIGEGSFGKVYKIKRETFGKEQFSALKIIQIPQSQAEIDQAYSEGMDNGSATAYFQSLVDDITREIDLMSKFIGNSNIVSYADHQIIKKEDGIGWTILIRMELLTSLKDYIAINKPSQTDVIKLGIDICRALELCKKQNIIHRDIKAENIFISENGDYKLGDFGIARQMDKTMSGLSKKGTHTYMAPEVYLGKPYSASVDIYSLGIVMYRLLNDNRAPFLPPYPEPITFSDRETAECVKTLPLSLSNCEV